MTSKISGLIDSKLLAIVKLFLAKPDELFHLQKISQDAKIPIGTVFRLTKKLANLKILTINRVGKLKLYKLNNENVKELEILK